MQMKKENLTVYHHWNGTRVSLSPIISRAVSGIFTSGISVVAVDLRQVIEGRLLRGVRRQRRDSSTTHKFRPLFATVHKQCTERK